MLRQLHNICITFILLVEVQVSLDKTVGLPSGSYCTSNCATRRGAKQGRGAHWGVGFLAVSEID